MSDPAEVLYELLNPSDPYTLRAADEAVACAAAMYLGEGAYGLRRVADGEMVLPVMLVAGSPLQWFLQRFGVTFQSVIDQRLLAIASCLETVELGSPTDRAVLDAQVAGLSGDDLLQALEVWRKRRTSLNDIGAHARDLTDSFRRLEARRRRVAGAGRA